MKAQWKSVVWLGAIAALALAGCQKGPSAEEDQAMKDQLEKAGELDPENLPENMPEHFKQMVREQRGVAEKSDASAKAPVANEAEKK